MTNIYPLLFPFLLLLTLRPITAIDSCEAINNSSGVDYICTVCNSTLYPEICYTSLSRYASAIQTDPARLALFAINLSLSHTRQINAFIKTVTHIANFSSNATAGALHDCLSNLGDAVDEIRESLNEMIETRTNGATSFQLRMSDVETWMSAALTDLETCTDGFMDVPDSDDELKKKVCDRVEAVKKIISNALALVNIYASKGGTP